MEPISIFAAAVILVGGCHIVFSAVNLVGHGVYSKGKDMAQRDDWYCFFKTSDLLGVQGSTTPSLVERQQQEKRRRPQQRLRA